MTIRPLLPPELDIVAERMRDTLVEVLGPERGATMYSPDWLRDRVRQHLDNPDRAVLVAVVDGEVVGHTIVRMEPDHLGLVSTTYVLPNHRRGGLADALLAAGERFLRGRGATTLATYTSDTNTPLIRLYEKHGYTITLRDPAVQMVRLSR